MNEDTNPRRTVLVVDDHRENIDLLKGILRQENCEILAAENGTEALAIALSQTVELILLDVMMPGIDGFETCRRLKDDPRSRHIPVIFVTALHEIADEAMGFACGGVDYVTKPLSAPVVRARVKTHLALFSQQRDLEDRVRARTAEVNDTRMAIIKSLGLAGEFKDNETGRHVLRMSHYSQLIGEAYGLPGEESELLFSAATMHDIGKIGIPDRILLKPGKLDAEEWKVMKTHCEIGRRIIGEHHSFLLRAAAGVAFSHHEKWDGSGYPRGLKGEEIPIFSRIVALADVFDALTSERPYKRAWTLEETLTEIERGCGQHFDLAVAAAFVEQLPRILEIKEQFADT